jgi:integrase
MEDLAAAKYGTSDLAELTREVLRQLAERSPFGGSPQEYVPPSGEALENIISAEVRRVVGEIVHKTILSGEPLPEIIREKLSPARVRQVEDGIKAVRGEATADPSRTVKALADDWFHGLTAHVSAGIMSPDRADAARRFLAPFVAYVGETADVKTVDAATLTAFHRYCLSRISERAEDPETGWGVVYAREIFATARNWIRWLVEQGTIEPPTNLASRGFRFGSTLKRIKTWTVDEIHQTISAADGTLKLALLLMLNCGMTQQDVSDLRDDEVNWRDGRIIRRRSKTAHRESVPVVNYTLWPETFRLLKQYRSGSEHVLLTGRGYPFVRKRMKNGRLVKVDGFARRYLKLRRRLGHKRPMKLLRKTAASRLETHETYGRFVGLYLGHAPASMKDRHYAAPPQELFDAAVLWLGEQLGVDKIEM